MLKELVGAAALIALVPGSVAAQSKGKVEPALVDKYVKDMFKGAPADWQARVVPDEAQRICSETRGTPAPEVEKKLIAAATASVVYPADGKVIGDWIKGQELAQRGTGGQFSDGADTPKGANCYACHQLSRGELSFGTLGPSLLEYGKLRQYNPEEAKSAYAKIYNAQVTQPCSYMPRFGANKFLSVEDIKNLTAYLFDPESPVNK